MFVGMVFEEKIVGRCYWFVSFYDNILCCFEMGENYIFVFFCYELNFFVVKIILLVY